MGEEGVAVECPVCHRHALVQVHGAIGCPGERWLLPVQAEGLTLGHLRQALARLYEVSAARHSTAMRDDVCCCGGKRDAVPSRPLLVLQSSLMQAPSGCGQQYGGCYRRCTAVPSYPLRSR